MQQYSRDKKIIVVIKNIEVIRRSGLERNTNYDEEQTADTVSFVPEYMNVVPNIYSQINLP